MEILTSGSFINLENRDKIEQLKYTATELANAALQTEGFVNEEAEARKLAHEFWQGLEYMCRETEEVTIQNIFIGQFLAHLHEFRRPPLVTTENPPPDEKANVASEDEGPTVTEQDEFLGVLASENQEPEMNAATGDNQEIPTFAETLAPPQSLTPPENSAAAGNTFSENISAEDLPVKINELVKSGSESSQPGGEDISQTTDSEADDIETDDIETEEAEEIKTSETAAEAEGAGLTLPEKEPYQFNKCTVTIVVQLLPVEDNSIVRKAILSVRTHDFVPQISLVELAADNLLTTLAPEVERAAAKYKSDLPIKVMDKLKREKTKPKKQQAKPTSDTKPTSPVPPPAKNSVSGSSQAIVEESNQAKSKESRVAVATVLPQVETSGLQGSLF